MLNITDFMIKTGVWAFIWVAEQVFVHVYPQFRHEMREID